MKARGADIVAFFNSKWPEGWFVDDGTLDVYADKIVSAYANEGKESRFLLSMAQNFICLTRARSRGLTM